jgi:RNA ligase
MNLFEFQEEEPLTFSFSRLQKLIAEGYITRRKHPTEDLWILNYTARAQYDRVWTPETKMCRGLVVNERWVIQARPWPKFFNWEELTEEQQAYRWGLIRDGHCRIADKMDGSLIIVFWYNGRWHCTTRGSFESEQAEMARAILAETLWVDANTTLTYLFELICPENRIVVDYGNERALYFLGAVDTSTGRDVWTDYVGKFPSPQYHHPLTVMNKTWVEPNTEGLVVAFEDGFRFKMKTDEYKRLHKLLCHVTPKTIWEMLVQGEDPADLCEKVPDEFYKWVQETASAQQTSAGVSPMITTSSPPGTRPKNGSARRAAMPGSSPRRAWSEPNAPTRNRSGSRPAARSLSRAPGSTLPVSSPSTTDASASSASSSPGTPGIRRERCPCSARSRSRWAR